MVSSGLKWSQLGPRPAGLPQVASTEIKWSKGLPVFLKWIRVVASGMKWSQRGLKWYEVVSSGIVWSQDV